MKNVYAERIADGFFIQNISSTNILPDGCKRFFTDEIIKFHESGAPLYKNKSGKITALTLDEIKLDQKYKEWFNEKIYINLEKIDKKSARSMRAITKALAKSKTPDAEDVSKIEQYENEAIAEREKLL